MQSFGEFIKDKRIQKKIALREFCRTTKIDPSNWSKIERGVLPPPKNRMLLQEISNALKIEYQSEDFYTLMDLAAISFIPKALCANESVIEKLPVFFRTLRSEKPSRKELEELIKLIKEE